MNRTFSHLKIERKAHVAILSIDRPDRRNALNEDLMTELEQAIESFRDDLDTRVVVLTGSGRHFCSGADLEYLMGLKNESLLARRRRVRRGERVYKSILDMEQISICAWNGAAIGGGACLVTATDMRVGSEDCFIEYPEIDIGLNVMWNCVPRTVRLFGEARATRLLIGGERAAAEKLLQWGVIEEVVPAEQLLSRTFDLAARIARKPPMAAQMIKRSISHAGAALDRAIAHADSDQHVLATLATDHERALRNYQDRGSSVPYTGD